MEPTTLFYGQEQASRPPQAVESLPALHLLERGGAINAVGDNNNDADLASSGRRHSSLDSAHSTHVTAQGSMQGCCDVMSEDEASLRKQQSKQKMGCGGSNVGGGAGGGGEEEKKKEATKTSTAEAAAAAAPPPPPPLPPSSSSSPPPPTPPRQAPTEDGTGEEGGGGKGDKQKQQKQQKQQQEEQQEQPLNPAAASALAAATSPSSSPDFVCCDPAVPAYVERHSRFAARLAAAMDRGPEGDSQQAKEEYDRLLLSLVGECGAAFAALRDARRAALDAGRVAEVAAGAFVHPGQRLLAWMGGARPSDYLSCVRAMLVVWGEQLSPEAATSLSQLQAAVSEQQRSMTDAFGELSERLARTAAVARYVRASCAARGGVEEEEGEGEREGEEGSESGGSDLGAAAAALAGSAEEDGGGGFSPPRPRSSSSSRRRRSHAGPRASDRVSEAPSPAASGIVDDMRSLLRHADELRALVSSRVCEPPPAGLLSPRQQALFWLCVQDIIELEARPTPKARPRAGGLGGGGAGLSVRRPEGGDRRR